MPPLNLKTEVLIPANIFSEIQDFVLLLITKKDEIFSRVGSAASDFGILTKNIDVN